MNRDEKYWKDYTGFLKIVSNHTKYSPANLIEQYLQIIESLENGEYEDAYFNEIEFDLDFPREIIQDILTDPKLNDNDLMKAFEQNILELDKRMKKFLTDECLNQEDWFLNVRFRPFA